MKFFALSPEVAGQLGQNTVMDTTVHPPLIKRLHYEFDGWLGDDIVESFPCYIGTERLVRATMSANPVGVEIADVETSTSATFRELYPDRQLPPFFWLQVTGVAAEDDLGISPDQQLVVSERVLDIWRSFQLDNCEIEPYA